MFALCRRDVRAGSAPARNLEGGSEDLRTHEFRHLECDVVRSISMLREDASVR
jgi:hypothetical protein